MGSQRTTLLEKLRNNTAYILLMSMTMGICYFFGLFFRLLARRGTDLTLAQEDYGAAFIYAIPAFALTIIILAIWDSFSKHLDYADIPDGTRKRFDAILAAYSSNELRSFNDTIKTVISHNLTPLERKHFVIYLKHDGFRHDVIRDAFKANEMNDYIQLLDKWMKRRELSTGGSLLLSSMFAGFICMIIISMIPALKGMLWPGTGGFNLLALSQISGVVIGPVGILVTIALALRSRRLSE